MAIPHSCRAGLGLHRARCSDMDRALLTTYHLGAPNITIEPATFATASYIIANLRPEDAAEVWCQLPAGVTTSTLAYQLVTNNNAWVANTYGQPTTLFGVGMLTPVVGSPWALGAKRLWRTIPKVTTHFLDVLVPERIEQGMRVMEVRALATNNDALRWIKSLGGAPWGEPYEWGRDGELFQLFRCTVPEYRAICGKRRK